MGIQRAQTLAARLAGDRFVRNNAIFFAGTFAAGVLAYAYHFITARLLGPVGYSAVASAIAALYLLTLPAFVLQTVSMRFASLASANNDTGRLRQLVVRITVLNLVIAATIGTILLVLGPAAARFLQVSDPRFVYVLAAATAAGLLVAGNRGVIQGMRRFVALSANVVLDNVTRIVVALVAIAAHGGPLGALTAIVIGPGLAYAQTFLVLRGSKGQAAAESVSFSDLGRYAGLAAAGVIGVTFLFNADVVLAKHFLSPEQAGIYAAGSVLARVVYFLGLTIAGVMFPEVAALHARNEGHFRVVDLSLLFMVGVTILFVATYALFPGLALLPFGAGYAPVRPLLGLFALALSLLAISNLLVNYFLSLGSLRFVPALLVGCILEVVLIARFHANPAQILDMVVVTMVFLAVAMAGLYGLDRFTPRRSRSDEPAAGNGRVNIIGVGVSVVNMEQALERIDGWVGAGERSYVCVCPVHSIMECRRSPVVRKVFNGAGMVTPDGMPVVWVARLSGFSHVHRVYGPDLMLAEMERSLKTGHRHFFFGGGPGVAERLAGALQKRFPGIAIAGTYEPPYAPLDELCTPQTADRINAAKPDVVWVGMSSPKQDLWMARMRSKLEAPVLIAVGAAFDFHSGTVSQAPLWMQHSGLEWVYRLGTDPRRLWRRYLIDNPWFIWELALQKTGIKKYELA